jgi:hypothetical protein
MYGLPVDTDVSAFVGTELTSLSLGKWQVSLVFGHIATSCITVEGDYSVGLGTHVTRFDSSAGGIRELAELLMETVTAAGVEEEGTLRLTFANGTVVQVHDSETAYESYQFTIDGHTWVV